MSRGSLSERLSLQLTACPCATESTAAFAGSVLPRRSDLDTTGCSARARSRSALRVGWLSGADTSAADVTATWVSASTPPATLIPVTAAARPVSATVVRAARTGTRPDHVRRHLCLPGARCLGTKFSGDFDTGELT